MKINKKTLKIGQQFLIGKGVFGAMSGKDEEVAIYAGTFEDKYVFTTTINRVACGNMELSADDLKNNPFARAPIDNNHPAYIPNCDSELNNPTIALMSVFGTLEKKQQEAGRELTGDETFATLFEEMGKMIVKANGAI